MSPDLPPTPRNPDLVPALEALPLVARYQAAWTEHGTRVTLRQETIQMYLTVAGVIYGFWFTGNKPQIDRVLLGAISFLTLSASLLIWMHNPVMQQLLFFMKNCEEYACNSIEECGGKINLFYFYDKSCPGQVAGFHGWQRTLHRFVLIFILAATNGFAIYLTWNKVGPRLKACCFLSLVFSIFILLWGLRRDRTNS